MNRPEWMTDEGYQTLRRGYLQEGEEPVDLYHRLAKSAAKYSPNPLYFESKFFDAMWKGWLCPSSPVLSNLGTARGLPISCNSIHVGDSVDSIFSKVHELAMLSKNGAGVGIYLGDIRARGLPIKGNGHSEGIVPWAKLYDQTTISVNQGSTRRGASALFLPADHGDAAEFINIRRPVGDINRRCLNTNHGLCFTDKWMQEMLAGDAEKRALWIETLRARVETGEPYMVFLDAANRHNPSTWEALGLSVKTTNICTEIFLHTDPDHSFVCCLSSLNLAKWHEWKDTDLPEIATVFLDCVLSEYIEKAQDVPGLEASVRSAIKGRAIGIGVLGWHTLLQKKGLPFDSFYSMQLNAEIFRTIKAGAVKATNYLGATLGSSPWAEPGRRNSHLLAIAPTVSNSTIAGGHSAGIEPIAANVYSVKGAKGTFIRQNPQLDDVLRAYGKIDAWKSIIENDGSVQHLDFMNYHHKEVFRTAREINQFAIVRQAAQRQRWVCQGQSVNLFFPSNPDPRELHRLHVEAWESGLKSLYYLRSEGTLKGDLGSRQGECKACEG